MPYTHVQFIAYEIDTFPESRREGSLTATVNGVNRNVRQINQTYKGHASPKTDVDWRCHLMGEALNRARTSVGTSRANTTLKVFMAPEFYFRGRRGAYDFETYSYAVQQLRALVTDDQWRDWLFVFGSLLVTWDEGSDKRINNVVLIQKGGSAGGEARAVVKEFMSGIDFLRDGLVARQGALEMRSIANNGLADSAVSHPRVGKPGRLYGWDENRGSGTESQRWGFDGRSIFSQDGISFGVEVCLDHSKQRLRKAPPAKGQAYIQVQLIPSAGMSIKPESVVAVRNGLVFNCDGNCRSDVKKVVSECSSGTDAQVSATGVRTQVRIPLHGGLNAVMARTCFSDPAAELKIYNALQLPPASQRADSLLGSARY